MQSTSCFFSNHSRSLPPYLFLYQLFVIICLSILLAEAQIPEVEWEKSFGGSSNDEWEFNPANRRRRIYHGRIFGIQ
jgi:hypothetical protein